MKKNLAWVLGFFMLWSCDYIKQFNKQEEVQQAAPIARVHDKKLYPDDLKGLVPENASKEDSTSRVERFVDAWIKKQLMMHVAEENTTLDEAEINRRIEDYKYDLLVYAYEKQFVAENLDTLVTGAQIEAYYEENKSNFELRQNIVKGVFLTVPKDARKVNALKKWMQANPVDKQLEKIKDYALSSATAYHINDSVWIEFDDLIINTPFVSELPNKIQTLKRQKFLETDDEDNYYFIRILSYKLDSDTSPIEFVQDQIKDIILNKRRMELRKAHEKSILEQAKNDNSYEVY